MRTMLKSKIHRATVTGADADYEGSITLDPLLMEAADIIPYEQVHVLDVTNGARLETYAIRGIPGSGEVTVEAPTTDATVTVEDGFFDSTGTVTVDPESSDTDNPEENGETLTPRVSLPPRRSFDQGWTSRLFPIRRQSSSQKPSSSGPARVTLMVCSSNPVGTDSSTLEDLTLAAR